ncbi:ABC transporter-like protein [Natrialba chahannaoensis JCM 10990]|uniref:ABC transporter-like protein n=1 Tax=Natrialba chahannaoensis JCM 10990 TaxID=1227492 RepID=M0AMB5_9EURY|nr:hypothetical protein [Natrialba chahannaoensis]ELY99694.1 ABC transporter-like protein [Natrialba chahannaoensis JCM 10990]
MLTADDLDAGYGDLQVLSEVVLTVEEKEYVVGQGENRYEGSGDALLANEQVRQDFIGGWVRRAIRSK